ncbi:hypothetical protein [Streptomyces sp. NPDC102437]|uniref:hypothetical protein n=1 Tax=Streptomyces sp. NPDC102437 TaxID=3366175 RepID=UPI00380EAA96
MRNQDVDDDAFASLSGEEKSGVSERTDALLDGPTDVELAVDPAASVIALSASLPKLEDIAPVEDDDTSELSDTEKIQKGQTEDVIRTAHAAGKAAVWVIGQGIAAAARGKWFRRTHPTLEAYVADLVPEVVPRQARRWVAGSPLALAIAARTGEAPNEGQIRGLIQARGDMTLPQDLARDMYVTVEAVAKETGQKVTAKVLEEFRDVIEDESTELPAGPEEREAVLTEWARAFFAGPIGPDSFETESNEGEDGEPADDVQDAEVVETPHLDSLTQALVDLKAARKAIKRATFEGAIDEGEHDQYRELVTALRTLSSELKRATDRAPWPAVPVPNQAEHQDNEEPEGATV